MGSSPAPVQKRNPLGYLFLGGAIVLAGFVVWAVYEWLALSFGLFPPITWEVARAEGQHFYAVAGIGMLVTFMLGALTGHFFWAQQIPPWFRARRG